MAVLGKPADAARDVTQFGFSEDGTACIQEADRACTFPRIISHRVSHWLVSATPASEGFSKGYESSQS